MEQLYEKIKHLREEANYTQRYMADELGVDCATYSRLENGKIDITVSRLVKMAKILNVFPGNLFTENPDKGIAPEEANAEITFQIKISADRKQFICKGPLIKEASAIEVI
jgi:transcriptional regulator with XRE-family HTH domain